MSKALNDMERLAIERACEQLVYSYARSLDLGDLSGAADCFAENASMARPMTPDQVVRGREAIRAALLTRPKSLVTRHLTSNVVIQVQSHEEATGLSYLTMIAATPGPQDTPPFVSTGPIYFGEFKDRFVREDGVWKFRRAPGCNSDKVCCGHAGLSWQGFLPGSVEIIIHPLRFNRPPRTKKARMRLHPTGQFDNHAAANRHIEARPLAAAMGAEICRRRCVAT